MLAKTSESMTNFHVYVSLYRSVRLFIAVSEKSENVAAHHLIMYSLSVANAEAITGVVVENRAYLSHRLNSSAIKCGAGERGRMISWKKGELTLTINIIFKTIRKNN